MKAVVPDVSSKTVRVQGGALIGEVVKGCEGTGMCAVTGNAHCVGVGGWLLGGGFGPLSPKHGLGVDNLLSAKVVLADGSLVTADASTNPELFFGLRGGGG